MLKHGCLLPNSSSWAPNVLRVSAKYRLGVPVCNAERRCPFCKAGVLVIYREHGQGNAHARHDWIRDKLVSVCSSAILSSVVEKSNSFQKANHAPETTLPRLGKPAAFDVIVTSSLQSSSLTNAVTEAVYALDAADKRKYCLAPRR